MSQLCVCVCGVRLVTLNRLGNVVAKDVLRTHGVSLGDFIKSKSGSEVIAKIEAIDTKTDKVILSSGGRSGVISASAIVEQWEKIPAPVEPETMGEDRDVYQSAQFWTASARAHLLVLLEGMHTAQSHQKCVDAVTFQLKPKKENIVTTAFRPHQFKIVPLTHKMSVIDEVNANFWASDTYYKYGLLPFTTIVDKSGDCLFYPFWHIAACTTTDSAEANLGLKIEKVTGTSWTITVIHNTKALKSGDKLVLYLPKKTQAKPNFEEIQFVKRRRTTKGR